MKIITTFLSSMLLTFGMLSSVNAATLTQQADQFSAQQTEAAPEDGEKKKKKDGEEPDC